mgnify:FL=1
MEDQARQTRYKKKKIRKGRVIFLILFLVIIGSVGYSYVQFQSGRDLASDNKIQVECFDPDDNHSTV